MSYALVFYLGVMLGTLLGVGLMCLLAMSKATSPEREFSRPAEGCSVSDPPGSRA